MKKVLSMILTIILCLSLCACGNNEKYTKYEALINYLENGDYIGAHMEIDNISAANKTTEPPKETTTINITLDNWQDYFEITTVAQLEKNSFDELTGFYPKQRFSLKEQYVGILHDIDVKVEYSCTDAYFTECTYNMTTDTITIGEPDRNDPCEDYTGTFSIPPQYYYVGGSGDSLGNLPVMQTWVRLGSTSWHPDTFEINGDIATIKASAYFSVDIIRIQGTITLIAE